MPCSLLLARGLHITFLVIDLYIPQGGMSTPEVVCCTLLTVFRNRHYSRIIRTYIPESLDITYSITFSRQSRVVTSKSMSSTSAAISLTVSPLPRVISTHQTVLSEVTSLLGTSLLGTCQGSSLTQGSPTWPKRSFAICPYPHLCKRQKIYSQLLLSTGLLH